MAQNDITITVTGNLVADPELRFTPNGVAVANFRVASTPQQFNKQTNAWEDLETVFLTVNTWRALAENVTQTFTKGMTAIVTGALRQRSYETKEGEKRTVYEIEATNVGPDLRFATAQVQRSQGGQGSQGGQQGGQQGGFGNQAQGGFGNQTQGGFGNQTQGGFGNQAQGGYNPQQAAQQQGGFGQAEGNFS